MEPTLIGAIEPKSIPDVYTCFEACVRTSPESTAIIFDDQSISFSELAERAELLSAKLQNAGIKSGSRILIQMPRGPIFIVAVLATLSLRSVFVPISPEEPVNRRNAIYQTVSANAIVSVDERGEIQITTFAAEHVPSESENSQNLAYILHTSGSTGSPKGVAISHAALRNCLSWHIQKFSFGANSRISHLSLPTFDLSIGEIFLPIVTGGTMIIPSASLGGDLLHVLRVLARANVSVIQMVPTILGRFIQAIEMAPHVRRAMTIFGESGHMICNGESLPDSMRRSFYQLFPGATLHNCYGPTEACVAVTEYECPRDLSARTMLIGKPVPNVLLYVVDDSLKPVQAGHPGELLIGGVQVATGYVGNPGETERRFLRIRSDRSDQLYRTGDSVRINASGELEFLGRIDDQVKFRSVRIELGEIESVASKAMLCSDARAIVVDGIGEQQRQELVLFVSPRDVDLDLLENYLHRELPRDRHPTKYLPLDALPATSNGKLDREQLRTLAVDLLEGQRSLTRGRHREESQTKLGQLLSSISAITGCSFPPDKLWSDLGIDSLAHIDLELRLLRAGLTLKGSSFHELGPISLRDVSDKLELIQAQVADPH